MRGLLALYGIAWVVGCVLAAVILTGLIDYVLRFRDPGIRLFCTSIIIGMAVWAVRRYLVQILSIPWHDADLARRLGHVFPALGDALPSAIEFLHQREDDPTAGSFGLPARGGRCQTTAEVEKINLLDAVRVGPVGKAVGAASIIFCIGLGHRGRGPGVGGAWLCRVL